MHKRPCDSTAANRSDAPDDTFASRRGDDVGPVNHTDSEIDERVDHDEEIEDEFDDEFDVDAEEDRLAELFADPRFAEAAAQRTAMAPVRAKTSNGSIGRALALGFANVFDPDRQKDEVVAVQERGEPEGPSTDLDRDNPKASRITLRRRK